MNSKLLDPKMHIYNSLIQMHSSKLFILDIQLCMKEITKNKVLLMISLSHLQAENYCKKCKYCLQDQIIREAFSLPDF